MVVEEWLDNIYERIKHDKAFNRLRISTGAQFPSPFVPGEGATENCQAFIVGEAPGAQEALKRRPFIGPAGKIQRQLMSLAHLQAEPTRVDVTGLNRAQREYIAGTPANCWLTNVVHYRPPGNRRPTSPEIQASRPYIVDEWKAVGSPMIIVPVGGVALEALVGESYSILKASGKCIKSRSKDGQVIFIWPMIHPAYALRNKEVQPVLERDWRKLAAWMQKLNEMHVNS